MLLTNKQYSKARTNDVAISSTLDLKAFLPNLSFKCVLPTYNDMRS